MSEHYTPIQINWMPYYPAWMLPLHLSVLFKTEAAILLKELDDNFLDVKLVPAPEQKHHNHMIRSAENSNPEWYSWLYDLDKHTYRRDRITKYLHKIMEGTDELNFKVHTTLREIILGRLLEGYVQDGQEVPPNEEICNAFLETT